MRSPLATEMRPFSRESVWAKILESSRAPSASEWAAELNERLNGVVAQMSDRGATGTVHEGLVSPAADSAAIRLHSARRCCPPLPPRAPTRTALRELVLREALAPSLTYRPIGPSRILPSSSFSRLIFSRVGGSTDFVWVVWDGRRAIGKPRKQGVVRPREQGVGRQRGAWATISCRSCRGSIRRSTRAPLFAANDSKRCFASARCRRNRLGS